MADQDQCQTIHAEDKKAEDQKDDSKNKVKSKGFFSKIGNAIKNTVTNTVGAIKKTFGGSGDKKKPGGEKGVDKEGAAAAATTTTTTTPTTTTSASPTQPPNSKPVVSGGPTPVVPDGPFKITDGMIIALKGGKSNRFCADEGSRVRCSRTRIRSWEKFTVKVLKGGKMALKGGRTKKWCTDDGNRVTCNRNVVKAWEKFSVEYHGDKVVSLKGGRSAGRKYCSDEGSGWFRWFRGTSCNSETATPAEKFTVICLDGCDMGGLAAGGGFVKPPPAEKLTDGMVISMKGGKWKKHCADEGYRIKCDRARVHGWEKFTVKVLKDGKVALKGGRNKKWCADEGNRIRCNRNVVKGWEKFTVVYYGGSVISLKGGRSSGQKFCGDEGHTTKCNRRSATSTERFIYTCLDGCNSGGPAAGGGTVKPPNPAAKIALADNMVIALKGGRWKKLCADEGSRIKCNRNHIKSSEKFTVKALKGGKIALKGGKDGKWCADEGNTIKCNRNQILPWEKFDVVYNGGSSISLKGGRGHKYCADEGHITKCNRGSAAAWEKFEVVCVDGCATDAESKAAAGTKETAKKLAPALVKLASVVTRAITFLSEAQVKKTAIPPGKTCVRKTPIKGQPVSKMTNVAQLATECSKVAEAQKPPAPAFVVYPKGAAYSNCWVCTSTDLRQTRVQSGASYVVMTGASPSGGKPDENAADKVDKASKLKAMRAAHAAKVAKAAAKVLHGAKYHKMKKCCKEKNFFLPCSVRYNGFFGIPKMPDYEYAMNHRGKKVEYCCPGKTDAAGRKCFRESTRKPSSIFGFGFKAGEGATQRLQRDQAVAKQMGIVKKIHEWMFPKGARPLVCVDPDNEATVIATKHDMIKLKLEKGQTELDTVKNAKVTSGAIVKVDDVEDCKKDCEKRNGKNGEEGASGGDSDGGMIEGLSAEGISGPGSAEVDAELLKEKAQIEADLAKAKGLLEVAEKDSEEAEAKRDKAAEDKKNAAADKNNPDPAKKAAAAAALAQAEADDKAAETKDEEADKNSKKAEQDGVTAVTKDSEDGKKAAKAKEDEIEKKKDEEQKKAADTIATALASPTAKADADAKTANEAKSTKSKVDGAKQDAAKLPGGGVGPGGRGSYFCCSQESALGGVSTLEESEDPAYRAAALPFTKAVEATYDDAKLPDVVSEKKLFQSGKISVENTLEVVSVTENDGEFHYTLKATAIRALCGDKVQTLSDKQPAGDLPIREAVAPELEGKPVDQGNVATIVTKAGGAEKAAAYCTTCGSNEKIHPYNTAGIKAAGVALLQKDCKENKAGIEQIEVKIQFFDAGGYKLSVKASDRDVVEQTLKTIKNGDMCTPVPFYHGALSVLFCSKGELLPEMKTASGKTLKKHYKFGVEVVVGPGEIPVAGLSKRTPLIPLHPTGSYLGGTLSDDAKEIFEPCEKGSSAAVALAPLDEGDSGAGESGADGGDDAAEGAPIAPPPEKEEASACFNTVPNRCDYGKETSKTDAKNVMANRVATRRAMFLADAVINGKTNDGSLKDCKSKFEKMDPPVKVNKPMTTTIKQVDKGCPLAEVIGPWPMTPNEGSSEDGKWDPAKSRRDPDMCCQLGCIVYACGIKKPTTCCKGRGQCFCFVEQCAFPCDKAAGAPSTVELEALPVIATKAEEVTAPADMEMSRE
eukprot:g2005.t1